MNSEYAQTSSPDWLEQVAWNSNGLIPVIAQDAASGDILMLAWMNRAALSASVERGEAVYWSRSRAKLWHKGETSGNVQVIVDIRLDCDNDALLLLVEQQGSIACHTGRHSCFFQQLDTSQGWPRNWQTVDPILKDPAEMYGK